MWGGVCMWGWGVVYACVCGGSACVGGSVHVGSVCVWGGGGSGVGKQL